MQVLRPAETGQWSQSPFVVAEDAINPSPLTTVLVPGTNVSDESVSQIRIISRNSNLLSKVLIR